MNQFIRVPDGGFCHVSFSLNQIMIRSECHPDGRPATHIDQEMSWQEFSQFAVSSVRSLEDINLDYVYYCVIMRDGSIFIIQDLDA